jgi:hypothetical protein
VTVLKHVFGALARGTLRSPIGRRLAISVAGAVAVALLPILPATTHAPVHVNTTPVANAPWLDHLNLWRAISGQPALTENTTWSAGDYNHAIYMVKNGLITHYETPGVPYYTASGDTEAKASNIQVSSTTNTGDTQAIDWWMAAPFHAIGMMDPRLTATGFGSYRDSTSSPWQEAAALDVQSGNPFSGGKYPVYFPGNGTAEPLTTYNGGEFPDPLQACSGYSAPTGLPVFVQVGGNVSTSAGSVHSFTGNGVPLEHCVIDSTNPAVGGGLYYRGGVIVMPRQPLQAGVNYVVSLTVNGNPYTWAFTVGPFRPFNPNACTSVVGSTSPLSPAATGTQVTITGLATGCPNPRYRFWILPPGGPWVIAQDYSATASYLWPSPPTPGVYHLEVDARDATTVIPYDSAATLLFTLSGCKSSWMSAGVPSPQSPGATVTFTATSTGCATPEYKFFLQAPGGTWTAQTAYGAGTWAWNTTGLAAGTYGVGVWVRSVGSAAAYEAYWLGTYTLTGATCTATSLSTATASPQAAGASITYTAIGCSGGQFRFWTLAPGGSWTMQRDYGASSWTWNTTGLTAGTYQVGVWAREPGSANAYDAYGISTFELGSGTCISAGLSPSVATPQAPGTTVMFTASSNSCASPLYQFWLLAPGGSWTVMQPFGVPTTWSWNTTGYAAGSYQVGVWAKASASSSTYNAYYIGTFQLDIGPCTSASIATSPASPQAAGTTITFTAASIGCTAPRYEFWLLPPPGTTWSAAQPYGAGTTLTWNTAGLAPGPYRIGVWSRQNGSTSSYDSYSIITFWVG